MAKATGEKTCFVIAPIGADGSDVRLRSDQVLKHIIGPSAEACGYTTLRADHISEPGIITSQVIQHIVEDPLDIADLTGWNPNVFYEIALRHAMKKPIVQIINASEKIPFDVAASRTVHVDHRDLDSVARAKEEIVKQIKSVEKNPEEVDNPISVAMELQSLKRSDNPLEKSYAEIITMLAEIRAGMGDLRDGVRRGPMHPGIIEELMMGYDRLYRDMLMEPGKVIDPETHDRMRHALDRLQRPLEMLCMENGLPPDMFMRRRLKNFPKG
ncbi:MAG: hypothetical protein IPJ76_01745 [Flavobacteriales bacterium]|nr:MAG: hypothetical protein IPJ76_01745 [Flavobacteriales bacterium]